MTTMLGMREMWRSGAGLMICVTLACGKKREQPPPPPAPPAPAQPTPRDKVEALAHDLQDIDEKLDLAVVAVANAQNDADRGAAKMQLEILQRKKAQLEQRVAAARTEAARAERMR